KFVLGICSGFQAIANKTDIGRKSPRPVEIEGLGLIDVNFSPLISNDRVVATVTGDSFLTNNLISKTITGFHCHTYGKIEDNENHKNHKNHIMYSTLKRVNYTDDSKKLISASSNDDGNVVGSMIHGCLDENPQLQNNIFKFLDANDSDISDIRAKNNILLNKIRTELGIDTNISIAPTDANSNNNNNSNNHKTPRILMIGSTGSDSGKTFITTGIAGNLRKNGYRVAVLKVGPDIRDTVPSLYLTKENMESYASIKIGHLGWKDIEESLDTINKSNYDFVLIEGAMSILTGALNNKVPYSGFEIASAVQIPILLVSAVNKGGIESATLDVTAHSKFLQNAGINVKGIIMNKIYDNAIFERAIPLIKNETGINEIISVPKIKMDETSTIPEVKIKLEDFALAALHTAENYIDINKITSMGETCEFKGYKSFKAIKKLFNEQF
ncbi:MAG: AAA family ATPase, partial [Methanobacteriaceae archaeon]